MQGLGNGVVVLYASHLRGSIQCILISLEVLGNPAVYGVLGVSYPVGVAGALCCLSQGYFANFILLEWALYT